MIPTYTYAIKEKLITDYLGGNLVVALINAPDLGITDTPSTQQLNARRTYTMNNVFTTEIGVTALNGYARQIVDPLDITVTQVDTNLSEAEISVSWTAVDGDMEPFSHFVVIRGAELTNADPIVNGNNRLSTIGTIIFIEPVNNIANPGVPYIITENLTFNYTFKLLSSSEIA